MSYVGCWSPARVTELHERAADLFRFSSLFSPLLCAIEVKNGIGIMWATLKKFTYFTLFVRLDSL